MTTTPTDHAPDQLTELPGQSSGRAGLLAAARAELAEHGHGAISLRAVARRAGVSHAAPKYHFRDRAGLLTAVAAQGFRELAVELRGAGSLAELGRRYIDFGLTNPALFDLMFRPSELHTDNPELHAGQGEAFGLLAATVASLGYPDPAPGAAVDSPPAVGLMCWALVHGLTVLARDGAISAATATTDDPHAAAGLAHALTDAFTNLITVPQSKGGGGGSKKSRRTA